MTYKNMKNPPYTAYLRKSSESREKQALSIESQKREVQTAFPDLNITEWIEESKSAFKPYNRPKFAEMMRKVHEGKIHGIVAWLPDRMSRNEIDAGNITYAVRSDILKDLKFVKYPFFNSPEGIKQLQDSLTDSQYYSAKLGVDVKRGLNDKLIMGRMPCQAPIGYLNTKLATRGENKIIEDPERFNIVRKMWDLLLTGNYSVPQIRDIATNELGLLTLKKKKIGGGSIGYSSTYDMFANIFYTGCFMYKGKIYNGEHKPMITMAEFDLAQTILKEDGKPRAKTYEFAYGGGTLRCGECGYSCVGIEKIKFLKTKKETKTYTLYLCGSKKEKVTCNQKHNINETELEKQIKAELAKYCIEEEFLEWCLDVMKENNVLETDTEQDIKENVEKTIESKQGELKALIQMATKGFISDEEFKESRTELDKTINSLKTQLNEDKSLKNDGLMQLTERAFTFSTYALIALKNGDKQTKKEITKALGLNRTIKDKILNIEAHDWYSEIRKGSFSIKEVSAKFELELACVQKTDDAFLPIRSLLRDRPDLNRQPLP